MSRNYEKNFGRLNRLWLEKGNVKKEKRPKLSTLKTSDEISYWLPSIKEELDFFLKQTEVPCYTDCKINECRKHIDYLENVYKAFVRKLHQLNSGLKTTPWTARPYEKKDEACRRDILSLHPMTGERQLTLINSLKTPVLMHDYLYQEGEISADCEGDAHHMPDISDPNNQDLPLFESLQRQQKSEAKELATEKERCSRTSPFLEGTQRGNVNPFGLDYSSSDEDTKNRN